jgi:PAS domain S-box-containing protein
MGGCPSPFWRMTLKKSGPGDSKSSNPTRKSLARQKEVTGPNRFFSLTLLSNSFILSKNKLLTIRELKMPRLFHSRKVLIIGLLLFIVPVIPIISLFPLSSQAQSPPRGSPALASKSILFLYSAGNYLPAHRKNLAAFMSVMEGAAFPAQNIYFENLDLLRNNSRAYRLLLLDLFHKKYADRKIDLIITVEGLARDFVLEEGKTLFPKTPILSVLTPEPLQTLNAPNKIIQIPSISDNKGTLEAALTMFPKAKRVFIVVGSGKDELRWEQNTRRQLASWQDKVEFEYSSNLTYEEMLHRVATLPPDTVVLYIALFSDKTGRAFVPAEVAGLVSQKANAPVFALYDQILDLVLGGSMLSYEAEGARAAGLALDLLSGRFPLTQSLTTLPPLLELKFNWQHLQRWGIKLSHLPPGSTVINRPASIWDSYKDYVIGFTSLIIIQAGLIIWLIHMYSRRKKAELSRRLAEERYRRIVELASEGITAVDGSFQIIFVNRKMAEMLGYEPEEMIGRTLESLIRPEDREAHRLNVMKLSQGLSETYERCFIRKDGNLLWVLVNAASLYDDQGVFSGAFAMYTDITERKQVEEDRHRRTAELTALNALGRDINARLSLSHTVTTALNGLLTTLHPDLAFLFLRQGDQLILQDIQPNNTGQKSGPIPVHKVGECLCGLAVQENKNIFSSDIYTDQRCTWEDCKQAGVQSLAVLPLRRGQEVIGVIGLASYGRRYFEQEAEFLETLAGQVAVAMANAQLFEMVQQELMERKRAEEAFRQSEDKFRLAFMTSPDAININRLEDGLFVDINQGFTDLTGFTREDAMGKTSLEMNIWHDPADRKRVVQDLQEKGYCENLEAVFCRKDKSLGTGLMSSRLIMLAEIPHIISITRDISDRIRIEKETKKLETQLRQAQKMEAIGTLAGGIAHDFNNILTIIVGCTELALLDIPEKNPTHQHLMQVMQAGGRATDLVKQILAFSRQEEQERRLIQPDIIVREALKMLRSSIPSTIRISQKIEKNSGVIMADPTQIHQILMNLCTNAFHAMRDNGGEMEVRLTRIQVSAGEAVEYSNLSPGPYIKLMVSDTGIGMEPQVMERIFDPYFTTKGAGEGTGLGLAVIYGIVKRYKGTIIVHSHPGKGSLFEVLLPSMEYADNGTQTPEQETIPGGKEKILLVDDEKNIVYTVQNMLTGLGYQVTSMTGSIEALETFHITPGSFDIIITDLTMPHLTGVDLSRQIKRIRSDIPIILCTGYSEMIDEKKIEDLGIQAFLMKPIGKRVLAETIRRLLDQRSNK